MPGKFLTAEWLNLLMVNYEIDAGRLKKYLPAHAELDPFNGKHYVSLVGFLFKNTRVGGIAFPFHRHFEEVNLRFYVRVKQDGQWRRGVVFIKEIVPRRMISLIANSLYAEKYMTLPMNHQWVLSEDELYVAYNWKLGTEWNYLRATARAEAEMIREGSEEEFITEHYWGYNSVNDDCTGLYEVIHPKWKVHQVHTVDVKCSAGELYGSEFTEVLNRPPLSVFLAEGSPITVMSGSKIVKIPGLKA